MVPSDVVLVLPPPSTLSLTLVPSVLVMAWQGSCLAQLNCSGYLGCCVENYSQKLYELGIIIPVLWMRKLNIRKVTTLSKVKQPEVMKMGFKTTLTHSRALFFLVSLKAYNNNKCEIGGLVTCSPGFLLCYHKRLLFSFCYQSRLNLNLDRSHLTPMLKKCCLYSFRAYSYYRFQAESFRSSWAAAKVLT